MEKAKVFVIMPFADEFYESYELMKNHFSEGFEFTHAGEEDNQQNILADIIPPIYNADIVLADLTGLNPNVMYELGIAHSFNKKTIIITRDELGKLPFDLKQYRAKGYSTHFKQFFDLLSYLEKHFDGAITGSVVFNNPVSDFLDKNKIDQQKLFDTSINGVEITDGDKGFLDFLADIEEDTVSMTGRINQLSADMRAMSTGIDGCTQDINRVKSTGGSGAASFVRKQAKKVASFMDVFSGQLKGHTASISDYWTKIEKNTFGLLENEYVGRDENKGSLIEYLKALHGMQISLRNSIESTKAAKQSSLNNMGMERSLNQSIRFLDEDLASYIAITEQMDSSIDRIIAKSKFVVGEIDFSQRDEKDV